MTTKMKRTIPTLHLSFRDNEDDFALRNEILRQSALTYTPETTIVRENLRKIFKEQGSLSIN
tara:strand:+ start:985 stop:1170 length:186 start_codon:yes stop_codon:yes gene_type:complete